MEAKSGKAGDLSKVQAHIKAGCRLRRCDIAPCSQVQLLQTHQLAGSGVDSVDSFQGREGQC